MPRLHLSGRACLLLYEQVAKTVGDHAKEFKKNGGQKGGKKRAVSCTPNGE